MANFEHFSDFFGIYVGSYDGRQSRLEISDVKADSPWPVCYLQFTDMDRGQTFGGTHVHKGPHHHVLTDIILNEQGGGEPLTWSRLHLHTWNTTYLSGISIWNGIEFGMSFTRV